MNKWRPALFLMALFLIKTGCTGKGECLSQTGMMSSGVKYVGMWDSEGRLMHFVIKPLYVSSSVLSISRTPPAPMKRGISSFSDGLYLNGEKIDTRQFKVFVYASDQEMLPVLLGENEIESFRLDPFAPESIKAIDRLSFWREKIEPLVDAESERWKELHFSQFR